MSSNSYNGVQETLHNTGILCAGTDDILMNEKGKRYEAATEQLLSDVLCFTQTIYDYHRKA